jgi:alpha-aminoadipic semialdehyde synthase
MIPPSAYLVDDAGRYDREAYYANPASFHSNFSTTIAPYLTTLINGAGWQPGFPRLVTNADLEGLIQRQGGQTKLVAVQDVACDLKVSVVCIPS